VLGVTSPVQYASLVGIPVSGVFTAGSSNYTIESSYLSLACQPSINITNNRDLDWEKYLGFVWKNRTLTNQTSPFSGSGNYGTTFFLDTYLPFTDARYNLLVGQSSNATDQSDPLLNKTRQILFGSYLNSGMMLTNCTIDYVHTESLVSCPTADSCSVIRVRPSQSDTRPRWISPFDDNSIAYNFALNFPQAAGQNGQSGQSTPTEVFMSFLSSPYTGAASAASTQGFVNLFGLGSSELSARLSLVLSTYWQVSTGPTTYTAGLPANANPVDVNDDNPVTEQASFVTNSEFVTLGGTSHNTTTRPIWVCSFVWASLLFASSSILLVVGLAGLVLKLRTRGPDMLGFVSSLTHDNVHVPLGGGGAVLGMERSRLLKNMRLKIGDVKAREEVGHIALAADGVHVGGLQRNRLYN